MAPTMQIHFARVPLNMASRVGDSDPEAATSDDCADDLARTEVESLCLQYKLEGSIQI